MKNIIKKKLKIGGMHCTSCAMNIDFDLEDLDGVQISKTSYARQETEIIFNNEKIDIAKIINQIVKTGYSAELKASE